MKITSIALWAPSLVALLGAPGAFAQSTASGTATSDASATTSASEAPSCTASLIAELCDYSEPFRAAASSGEEHCWEYCHENQPCDFVIFLAGNPYTGSGTCWVYPGEEFDPSKGQTEGCDNGYFLSVFDKPVCDDPSPTESGGCSATASPSAVASVCDYPPPDEKCWNDCYASSGASNCLSICAEADSCNYAVFNPRGETNSPYEPGTCWVYPEGKYNADNAGECGSGGPEQYVYENKCPKPSKASTSSRSSKTATDADATGTATDDDEDGSDNVDSDEARAGKGGGSVGSDEDDEDAASLPTISLTGFFAVVLAIAML